MCNDGEICVWLLDPKKNWNPIEQCMKANAVNKGIISKYLDLEITLNWIQIYIFGVSCFSKIIRL